MQIIERNASIKAAWANPVLRARQSATMKLNHRNHEPLVNLKRSASLKRTYSDPAVRAKLSANKTAYWAAWREARMAEQIKSSTTEAAPAAPIKAR